MGAVNYYTSDYITMGIRPYDLEDFTGDNDFMEEIRAEVEEYGGTVEEAIENYISTCYEDDEANARGILEKYGFYYFHVCIKPGYYEGFTVDIENNFPVAFDFWQEKREAQKEITRLRRCLEELAGVGLVECSPGWCTGYSDYSGTLQGIREAVREMREEVRTTPTWAQYMKACGEA